METIDFGALFAADLETTRITFTVAGQDCHLDLRPLDAQDSIRYDSLAVGGIRIQGGELEVADVKEVDLYALQQFLVGRTVVGGEIVTRNGKGWGRTPVPIEPSGRETFFREARFTRRFWDWLFGECQRVNALRDSDQGN